MKKVLYIFICLAALGCKRNTTSQQETTGIDTTALNKKLSITPQTVLLNPEAKQITSEWLAYITAKSELDNFKEYTVKDVIYNAQPLSEIMKSLKETLPDTLQATPVKSRLSVLYTKARVLQQLSADKKLDIPAIKSTAQQLPVEFNNLNIQINELFLKTLEDFELELDEFEAAEEDTTSVNLPTPLKQDDSV
ncbi:hypothetical protein L1I30_01450 [Gillisia sp. M10.2A]|uniref:Lipoprotein n=1 Tax=Gillisia lutea TaxID=2909668 RepID=A0ABS9EEK4_9FLAO|nr:hypothetical protein [Gillisia lutea]MCF4100319.1 hypothetical protein [Gillisia lutea]